MSGLNEKRHAIKVVALRSGLSPHLIRMWERRYGAVTPGRTPTNRRLYSDDDIDRLILLKRATEAGESIGQIANRPYEELKELVPAESPFPARAVISDGRPIPVEGHLKRCLEAVRDFDAGLLQARLTDASMTLGRQVLLEQLLHPLLEETGRMWSDGEIKVAHEHLASAVVRSMLGGMVSSSPPDGNAPTVVATTLAGQHHEFGALMAAATASSLGWRVIYLGPNMPAENVAAAVETASADAVTLSIVYPPGDPMVAAELQKLGTLLPSTSRLLVGGRAAASYEQIIERIGGRLIGDLRKLRLELDAVRVTRPKLSGPGAMEVARAAAS